MMEHSKYYPTDQSVPFSKPAPLRKHRTTVEFTATSGTAFSPDASHTLDHIKSSKKKVPARFLENSSNHVQTSSKPSPLLRQRTAPDAMAPNWRTKTAVVQPSKASELKRQKSSLIDRFSKSRNPNSGASKNTSRASRSPESLPTSESSIVYRNISFQNGGESTLDSLIAHGEFSGLPQELFIQPESLNLDLNDPDTAVIGEGGQGKIIKTLFKGESVAIKFSHRPDVLREFLLTHQLRHPSIIRPVAFTVARSSSICDWNDDESSDESEEEDDDDEEEEYDSSVTFMALYEYCPNGDLAAWLTKFPELTRDEKYMGRIYGSILDALAHIHQMGYLHTDVKPENILVMEDGSVRLADFGMCQKFSERMIAQGTPSYLPPEMVAAWHTHHEAHSYTAAADLFSFGVLLVSTLTGKYPFVRITAKLRRGISFTTQELNDFFVTPTSRLRELSAVSHRFTVLAKLCLRVEPSERTDAVFLRKILNQP